MNVSDKGIGGKGLDKLGTRHDQLLYKFKSRSDVRLIESTSAIFFTHRRRNFPIRR